MSKLLDKALEAVRRLPPAGQDAIAQAMLNLIGEDDTVEEIDPTHLAGVLEVSLKRGGVSLQATKKSKPYSAVLTHEAAVYAAVADGYF